MEDYLYETTRLIVLDWHSPIIGKLSDRSLAATVSNILTDAVTKSLPPGWQGPYSLERAKSWINERDQEGETFLVFDRAKQTAIGLLILFDSSAERDTAKEFHLGYLLAESTWGNGFATELLFGLKEWCKQNDVVALIGGVSRDNVASQRVLEKVGFVRDYDNGRNDTDEFMYRLDI